MSADLVQVIDRVIDDIEYRSRLCLAPGCSRCIQRTADIARLRELHDAIVRDRTAAFDPAAINAAEMALLAIFREGGA